MIESLVILTVLGSLFVALPTTVIWVRSGRKSLRQSYRMALAYCARAIGLLLSVISGLILVFVLADYFGFTHFGYPLWSAIASLLLVAAGLGIWKAAGIFLTKVTLQGR